MKDFMKIKKSKIPYQVQISSEQQILSNSIKNELYINSNHKNTGK
jgi:hypothetical protein